MLQKTYIILGMFMIILFTVGPIGAQQNQYSENLDAYHFCHRCGMAVEKSDKIITVTGVPESPWYQCCPMCALMDIIECGSGSGTVIAFDNQSGETIEIVIANHQIVSMQPESTVLLVGGSCLQNKIFVHRKQAMQFIQENKWAKVDMLKPVDKAFAMLTKKKKALDRCAMCTTPIKGHEKTTATIITTDKKRMMSCCGHCLLFIMYKLKDNAKRAATPDFKTGRLIDAQKAYYVVGNDLVVCCYPSTISFEKYEDAREFQQLHGGEVMTYQEAMVNINKVMKKE